MITTERRMKLLSLFAVGLLAVSVAASCAAPAPAVAAPKKAQTFTVEEALQIQEAAYKEGYAAGLENSEKLPICKLTSI